ILEWQTRGAARSSAAATSGATQFEYGTIYSRGAFTILSENNSPLRADVSQEARHQRPSTQEPSGEELPTQESSVKDLPRQETSRQASSTPCPPQRPMSSRRHFTQPPARVPTFLHAAQYLKAHMAGTRSDHVVESTPIVRELERAAVAPAQLLFSRHHLV